MEIKGVLHFYLGCQVLIESEMFGVNGKPDKIIDILTQVNADGSVECKNHTPPEDDFKPILRPLSSMTEEEAKELLRIRYARNGWAEPIYERHSSICIDFKFASSDGKFNQTQLDWDMLDAASVAYLISKGFDLFNLIPEGKAIDATSLTQPLK